MERGGQGEIEILSVFRVLRDFARVILIVTALGTALGCAAIIFLPPKYKSENVFIVTAANKETPLEQWSALAEQFGFKIARATDPLLTMLDRVLASEKFYRGLLDLSVNPAYPESSLVRLLKVDSVAPQLRSKAFTEKITRMIKYVPNKDNSFSIIAKTRNPSFSKFLANATADHLNEFFVDRAKAELNRKIAFLDGELALNKRELDSLSGRLQAFLESNKDISSPVLAFRYKSLNQDVMVANEKYMLTMKAHQSLKISASQPEYFFESIVPAEESGPPSWKMKTAMAAGCLVVSFLLASAGVLFLQWLLRITWKSPSGD